jgi:hypothetical protein
MPLRADLCHACLRHFHFAPTPCFAERAPPRHDAMLAAAMFLPPCCHAISLLRRATRHYAISRHAAAIADFARHCR